MSDQGLQRAIPAFGYLVEFTTTPGHCFLTIENNTGVLGKLRLAPNDFNPVSAILIRVSVSISKIDEIFFSNPVGAAHLNREFSCDPASSGRYFRHPD